MSDRPSNQCPECESSLVFTPDGRSRFCENCGFRQQTEVQRPNRIADLEKALSFIGHGRGSGVISDRPRRTNLRWDQLIRGISAAKEGRADEAFFHLSQVLKAADSSDQSQATAWVWLSVVVDDPVEKRRCLENALAINPGLPEARRGLAILDGRLDQGEIIDPNRLPEQESAPGQSAQATEMSCPRCGARMNYTPQTGALQCDFCHFQQNLAAGFDPGRLTSGDLLAESDNTPPGAFADREQDFVAALATARGHRRPIHMRTFLCKRCAVTFVLGPETLSLTCPYCDSVYVTEAAEQSDLMPPHGLISFSIDQEQAEQRLRAWFQKHQIDHPRRSPMAGLYLPVWTFDIHGPLKWSCLMRKGNEWVRRTGEDYALFDDYLVPAVDSLPPELIDHLVEFELDGLVDYDPRYLADWPAERYQLSLADASIKARGEIMGQLRKSPIRYVGGNDYRDFKLNSSAGLHVSSFRLVLLPLWLVHYQVEDRSFDVMINGQQGTVHGSRPQSMAGRFKSWLFGQ